MKKLSFRFLTMMMVVCVSMCVVSCGSDDEGESGGNGSGGLFDTSLIGIWYESVSGGKAICAYKFENNGVCYYDEWSITDTETPKTLGTRFKMNWTTKEGILTIIDRDDDGEEDVEIYRYSVTNNGKTLTLQDIEGNGSEVYTKQ